MERSIEMCIFEIEDYLDALFPKSSLVPTADPCGTMRHPAVRQRENRQPCHADQPRIFPAPAPHRVRTIRDEKCLAREASLLLAGLFEIPLRCGLLLLHHHLLITIAISRRRNTSSLIARPLNLLAFTRERCLDLWKQFDQVIELVYRERYTLHVKGE